ncbi:nucleic acid-binding protein [Macroventuria anomochaeta]|uniref:Nucleic acid-binding protein n=1 Tax=Macroventuria anomochaeta TaxID=301207 RepID=A0ACB6SCY3_9PLEO|nr:nucleic acid-binding protein [Macroventuria anomochaeta]KAF2631169.1 nucleic acid-binding protein [Macroventuria anomochaeta]
MGRPKRQVLATIEDTITPPDVLPDSHLIARIVKAEGKNLYNAELPGGKSILAELEAKFRSTVWIKRGSYVIVDASALADRDNKLDGEIVNIVRDEKAWRKMSYWPKEFVKKPAYEDSDEEESTVGKMPPSDSDEE